MTRILNAWPSFTYKINGIHLFVHSVHLGRSKLEEVHQTAAAIERGGKEICVCRI